MNNNSPPLGTKLREIVTQFPFVRQALTLVWDAAPGWTTCWLVLLILQGLLPVATVYLVRSLVDGLVEVMGAGGAWENLRPIMILVVLLAAIMLITELLRSFTNWIRTAQTELVKDYIIGLIHDKSVAVDLSFYESPDYFDRLHRARDDAGYRPLTLLESIGGILQNGITLVAMAAVLIPYGLWLPVALVLSTLPALYVVIHHRLRLHQWRVRTTPDERKTWYYDWLLTARESAAELRLFGLGDHFKSIYDGLRQRLRGDRIQLAKNQSLSELGAATTALIITGAAMAWMVWRALKGLITLGDLALFYQAFNQGQRMMRSLLENVGEMYTNSLFLEDLFEFLALEPKVVDPINPSPVPSTLQKGITFDKITFHYPGSDQLALDNFNLTIPAGQIAAIVGPNGAGKSTLIKLLCRLYDPSTGHINVEGIDLRDLLIEDLRHMFTVLFQEPVRYNATVSENIALGKLSKEPAADEIKEAAQAAGAEHSIARLPKSYETLLGKWFAGGADLSVG
ncbi:MAG: ABC transporter ATP-binding protein, partial [Deltaproteobacteria bacterium]|nr:ABC transporter ATP-binding protein [Deltaproteobacteria bacterium]